MLVVDGKPFLALAVQANNSSNYPAMLPGVWAALDRVGVQWRFNRVNSISVARRDSVALMDEHVGPKR